MKWRYFLLTVFIAGTWTGSGFAQDISNVSLTLMPMQTAYVKGDLSKFKALNWTKDGSQSGIKDVTLDTKAGKDVTVSFEGSGMLGDEDYTGSMLLTKDNLGYVKLSYDSFRKYYENKGGYFAFPSAGMNVQTLTQDLEMDIGHFAMEVGKGSPNDPDFSFAFERDTKDGAKNNTTWGYVYDHSFLPANSTAQRRKIAPVFSEKDETTDTLTAKGKMDIKGFTVKGEQKYVFFDAETIRQERLYGNTGVDTENKIVRQTETPQTKELSTSMLAERWSLNDKTYLSFGYHYGQLRNSMAYVARDYTSAGNFTPAGFLAIINGNTGDGTFRNGEAGNKQNSHILSGQVLSNLTEKLTLISRLKGELQSIDSWSNTYALNSSEIGTSIASQAAQTKIVNFGESLSLRYSGISKTSLYADLDLKQENLHRSLQYPTSENIETINRVPEGHGTLGARFSPFNKVSLTTEFKHGVKTDKLEMLDGGTDPAYINKIKTISDSWSSRLSWKPTKWLENGFKVKESSNVNHLQAISLNEVKMSSSERDFVYDMAFTPTDQWMFNASYSLKLLKVGGVGSQSIAAWPASTSNVYTWALTSSYMPTEKVSVFNSLEYSRSKNRTNEDSTNLSTTSPMWYGIDAEWYNIDTGITLSLNKDLKIEPHYGYSTYRSFEGIETSNYSAHIVWLDITKKF